MDLLLFEVLEAASLDATPWPQSIAQYIHVYAQLSLNSVIHFDWPDGLCRRDPRVHLESRLIPPVTNRTNNLVAAAVSFINPTSERAGGREKFSWLRNDAARARGSLKELRGEWMATKAIRVHVVAVGMDVARLRGQKWWWPWSMHAFEWVGMQGCREGGAVEALPFPVRRRGRMSYFVGLERREQLIRSTD